MCEKELYLSEERALQWERGRLGFLSESRDLWESVPPMFSIRKLEALGAAREGGKPTSLLLLSHCIFLLRLSLSKEFFNIISTLILKSLLVLVGRLGMDARRTGWEGFLL